MFLEMLNKNSQIEVQITNEQVVCPNPTKGLFNY